MPQRYLEGAAHLLCALALCGSANGCHRRREQPIRPGIPVTVAEARQQAVPVEVAAVGNAAAIETVSVRAHVGGTLDRVYFVEGQYVERGDPLFLIDPRPFRAALAEAQGNLARDAAQWRNAERNRARYAALLRRGLVSSQDYDAQVSAAEAWGASLKADRGAVAAAATNLDYTHIVAPLSGKTGGLLVNRGNLVKADDTGALVVIRQITPIYVSFAVPAEHLPAIQRRRAERALSVTVTPPGFDDAQAGSRAIGGLLTFVDNAVDLTTGTVVLKATFENRDRALWPGQFVTARLRLQTLPDAITVPAQAVMTGQQGDYLFVVGVGSQAEQRAVEVAFRSGALMVIRRGVRAGEMVVTDGQLLLAPGARVEVRAPSRSGDGGADAGGNGGDGGGGGDGGREAR